MTAPASRYQPPLAHVPLNQLVQQQLMPMLDGYVELLTREPFAATFAPSFHGVPVFGTGDVFLPGKVAIAVAHQVLHTPTGSPRQQTQLQGCRRLMQHIAGMPQATWGIYYTLMALNRLRRGGLLDQAIDEASLVQLRKSLDWRHFVDTSNREWQLRDLPTNYFGVAFGVARLRFLMGWEDASAAEQLLSHTLAHYRRHSGGHGWSDETDGEGRFDRYSVLLIAELCERFIETELPVTPPLRLLLRQSAELALRMANVAGDGFAFGRSIGPYGDTAVLEILAAAACLGELSPDEKRYAYAHSVRCCAKYLDHWFDPAMGSVNLWQHGRSTDGYRGPHRMLGENLSLIHQFVTISELWSAAGMHDAVPAPDLGAWLEHTQPAFALTWFASNTYDRALVLRRDRGIVFQLPLISGGTGQHAHAPYYPLPFASRVIEGQADSGPAHPQLSPKLVLTDGSELLATCFMQHIEQRLQDGQHLLRYRQEGLNRVGTAKPVFDERISATTEYRFGDGWIRRSDIYTPRAGVQVKATTLDFASFSADAQINGTRVSFGKGVVHAFEVDGLPELRLLNIDSSPLRRATSGPMHSHLHFSRGASGDAPITVSWTLHYR